MASETGYFNSSKKRGFISVDVDSEDDVGIVPSEPSTTHSDAINSQSNSSAPPKKSTFLTERAQLEKERRERQKRMRREAGREESSEDEKGKVPLGKQNPSQPHATGSVSATIPSDNSEQIFWCGEYRQTATRHAEPRRDGRKTFKLTEILGKKDELVFAIISSYSLDFPWIYQFFESRVPVIMVAQPDRTGQATIKIVSPNWIKTTPHLRAGYGCQHMKFMLLFYKTGRLRVVISTANLISYDWCDMENTVWLQDIPLRQSSIPDDPKADDFAATLQRTLHAVNVRLALSAMIMDDHPDLPITKIEDLRMKWDWSKVKAHLLPSVAGKHEGWTAVSKIGHPRLMVIIRKMGMHLTEGSKKQLSLECLGSSIAAYTTQWMNEFYSSARGESAEGWLDMSKKRRERLKYPTVKIIYPSKNTVRATANGEPGGGTVFCRRRQWSSKNFPREHFYDSKSKGGPVLMHSKMILASFRNYTTSKDNQSRDSDSDTKESDDDIQIIIPSAGWLYLGSHNFTPSAWGTLSGSSFNPILNVTNYELGVVFPLKDEVSLDQAACWQRPPRKYTEEQEEPWIQEESIYHHPDNLPQS